MLALALLSGTLFLSPSRPVCQVGVPCTRPLPATTLVFRRSGTPAIQTRTDSHGRYRIRLAPGRYAISTPGHRAIGRGLEPRSVLIARTPRVLNLYFDAGIR